MNGDADEPETPAARRRGIQSVEIGMRVLEALVALGEPSGLSAIAEVLGMSASQTHRYLQSLIAADMALQDPVSGRYDLGPGSLRLGLMALTRIDALTIADAEIAEYARRTGRTVQIAALGPLGPTIVRWKVGRPPVMTSFNIGSVLPVLSSATGRVFLAFAPPQQTEHLVEREMVSGGPDRTEVEALRESVRKAGRSEVEGMQVSGLNAVAFPILNLERCAVLSATALLPTNFPRAKGDRSEDELGEVCRAISARLGWQPT